MRRGVTFSTRCSSMRFWALRAVAVGAVTLLLAGCYLPDRFRLDMQFQTGGEYAFIYNGDLMAANFLRKIGAKEVEATDKKEIQVYVNDLKRDSGFSSVEYLGQARYRVQYRRQSNILERPQFNFVRRNGPFLKIKRLADGSVVIEGSRPKKQYRDELNRMGFDIDGLVRLWAPPGAVLDHNAQQVQPGNPMLYIWDIKSINDPLPRLVMGL